MILIAAFYDKGRFKSEFNQIIADYSSGNYRNKSSKNYDGISQKLLQYADLQNIFEKYEDFWLQKINQVYKIGDAIVDYVTMTCKKSE